MDSLQILPTEKWPSLRDTLKRDWPTNAYYYNWVSTAIKWKNEDPQLRVEIFCPHGQYLSGVFIGVSSYSLYMAVIFAFDESKDLLREVLLKTKLFNWNKDIFFRAIPERLEPILLDVVDEQKKMRKIDILTTFKLVSHFKSKEECSKLEFKIPEDCYLKRLDNLNVPLIHSSWHYRMRDYPELTAKYLETAVRLNPGLGLFLRENDSLVSWAMVNEAGCVGMVQTLEDHSCKGYGKTIVKAVVKELAVKDDLDSVLYVLDTSVPALKFYESLGYRRGTPVKHIQIGFPKN